MRNANLYGFLPQNDAYTNSKVLQELVDLGGDIVVEKPGVYDLSETITIGDNTTLKFAKGVQIRRQPSKTGRNGIAFINKGALTHTYNRNITIVGLHLDCNGVESKDWATDGIMVGLRAQIGMIYINDLVIEYFECIGGMKKDYGIQISAFENIKLENLYIEGDRDGVHLGWGRNFVIRHGRFCTFDDPIALNAYDYVTSNTHVGWIENGIVEDCYDFDADSTTGFFCRFLGGAWCDWYEGIKVQHSDTVVSAGRVYRVLAKPDGNVYTSMTPPTHKSGTEDYNGIKWVCVRDEAIYDCGCRNVLLRDIHLRKKRDSALGISLNQDVYANSYYPGCKTIPQENITLERIYVENTVKNLLYSNYPANNIKIKNTDMKESRVYFRFTKIDGFVYPVSDLVLENVQRAEGSIMADEGHPYRVTQQ